MICFCKKTFFCTLLASISNDWHQSYFPPVFKLLFYLTFPVKSLKCALKLLMYEFFNRRYFSSNSTRSMLLLPSPTLRYFLHFFWHSFLNRKKSLPKQWVSLLQGLLLDTPEDYEKFLEKESHPCLTDLQYKDDDERVGVILLASFGLIFICFDMEFQKST